jgi:biopolymer transport protein ExbD
MLAFREFEQRFGKKKSADFTPLIDVMFNLLLFFILTSTVMAGSFLVRLPEARTSVAESPAGHTLVLTREGALFWDDAPIALPELAKLLAGANVKRLSLAADREAAFGRVTELMDMARSAGFAEIAFSVLEKRR